VTGQRKLALAAALAVAIVSLGVGQHALDAKARVHAVQAPRFEVNPLWPKPLPNHWVLGNVIVAGVDAKRSRGSCGSSRQRAMGHGGLLGTGAAANETRRVRRNAAD
jgi:hypothetical protein